MVYKVDDTMTYEEKTDKAVYFYNVTYDKERLKEILEKLKKYSYISIGQGLMSGNITKWPATRKNMQKRVISLFNSTHKHSNCTLYQETIVYNAETGFITYKYSFEKLPDLYHYIDIIVNNKSVMDYTDLFGYTTENLNMFYVHTHADQLVLEGILNYINSSELVNHNSQNDPETSIQKSDYKGLNELYRETLECFKFNLSAIKEYLDNQEAISGLSLQRKKQRKNNSLNNSLEN